MLFEFEKAQLQEIIQALKYQFPEGTGEEEDIDEFMFTLAKSYKNNSNYTLQPETCAKVLLMLAERNN